MGCALPDHRAVEKAPAGVSASRPRPNPAPTSLMPPKQDDSKDGAIYKSVTVG
jgi:hypothetical protein